MKNGSSKMSQFSIESFFSNVVRKQEEGERTLFRKKKRDRKNGNNSEKNVVFWIESM